MRLTRFLIGGLLLASNARAQDAAAAPPGPLDGSVAPADTWYTEGGCAARTGVSLTQPMARRPQVAWTFRSRGSLVGEPLLWGNVVVLDERRRPKEHILHVRNLQNGAACARTLRLTTDLPLQPSIWERHIAIRSRRDRVRVVEIERRHLKTVYEPRFREATVLSQLLLGDELYILTDKGVERHSVRDRKVLWEFESALVGLVTVRSASVYVIPADQSHGASGLILDRSTGKRKGILEMAAEGKTVASVDRQSARIVVGRSAALIYLADPRAAAGGDKAAWQDPNVGLVRHLDPRRSSNSALDAYAVSSPPCLASGNFYGLFVNGGEGRSGEWVKGELKGKSDPRLTVLANSSREAELLTFGAPVTVARDVAYIGPLAFNVHTQSILWRLQQKPVMRVVPARNMLLVRDGENQLVALGRRALVDVRIRPATTPLATRELSQAVDVRRAVAALADGTVVVDSASFSAGDRVLRFGSGPKQVQHAIADVQVLFDRKEGFVCWHGTPEQIIAAFTRFLDRMVTEAYVDLLKEASETNDTALMRRLRRVAVARGASERDVDVVDKRLALVERRNLKVVQRKVQQVLDRESGIAAVALTRIWKPFLAWSRELSPRHRAALFHLVLEHAPTLFDKVWPEAEELLQNGPAADQATAIASMAAVVPDRAAELWELFEGKLDAASDEAKATMARAVLEWEPHHEGAITVVRKLVTLPLAKSQNEDFQPVEWLDLIQTIHRHGVSQVKQPPPEEMVLPYEQRHLVQYQHIWRKDLIAFQSKRLLVITPPTNPAGIARCLSLGELVCDTLLEIFKDGDKKRHEALRLRLVICSTEKEYMKLFARGQAQSHLGWTAGHYDGRESRMYLPPGAAAFEQVMPVFAHELTHHWVDEQCPMFTGADRARGSRVPTKGEWIVEGFASMVEGFDFDLAKRTYRSAHPRIRHLDILANASPRQLLSWQKVLSVTYDEKHQQFGTKPRRRLTIHTNWELGVSPVLSEMNLFYTQATAACHFLFHGEGGKYRKRLLQYLANRYSGRNEEMDIQKAFGMSTEELGRRAIAHARQVVSQDG